MLEALHGLPHNPQRGEDAHPVVAKGLAGIGGPFSLCGRQRAFVACDGGSVVALYPSKGLELAQVPISGAPDAIWHNHRTARLYVAIEDPGVIDVVNTETMTIDEQIPTEVGRTPQPTTPDGNGSTSFCPVVVSPSTRKARCGKRSKSFSVFLCCMNVASHQEEGEPGP
jgi:hypothetical protein